MMAVVDNNTVAMEDEEVMVQTEGFFLSKQIFLERTLKTARK